MRNNDLREASDHINKATIFLLAAKLDDERDMNQRRDILEFLDLAGDGLDILTDDVEAG